MVALLIPQKINQELNSSKANEWKRLGNVKQQQRTRPAPAE